MIKSLFTYITESEEKTYDFKIKIAGIELTHDVQDRLEHSLAQFEIKKLSAPKRLPICNQPTDFPSFGPVEVSIITASLKYPCTDEQVRAALVNQGRIPAGNIVVIPKDQPEELRREEEAECKEEDKGKGKSRLETEIENVKSAQVQVGMERIESMLKELESRRFEFASKEKVPAAKTTNDTAMNTKSVVSKGAK